MQPAHGGQGQQTFQASSSSQAEAVAPHQELEQPAVAAATAANHQPQATAAKQPVGDRLAKQPSPQQVSVRDQWNNQPHVPDVPDVQPHIPYVHMQQDYMTKIARECCSGRITRASDVPRQFPAIVSYVPDNESSYCWIQLMDTSQVSCNVTVNVL
jgi:hypothetical protein